VASASAMLSRSSAKKSFQSSSDLERRPCGVVGGVGRPVCCVVGGGVREEVGWGAPGWREVGASWYMPLTAALRLVLGRPSWAFRRGISSECGRRWSTSRASSEEGEGRSVQLAGCCCVLLCAGEVFEWRGRRRCRCGDLGRAVETGKQLSAATNPL
jgi:hypothetical protein